MPESAREELLFGTAGIPLSSSGKTTEAGIERIEELGLGCMEVEFVRGVKMGERSALSVGEVARRSGVRLTAHGPYFINLNAHEPEKARASQQRVLQTARVAHLMGAESIVFHAAFFMGDPPPKVYQVVKKQLEEITGLLSAEGNKVSIRPEVMGKPTQFGSLEEILQLSSEVEGVAPCVDFAHLHARTGKDNSYPEFLVTLEKIEERLGREALDKLHLHVSGIHYGERGEIRHLILEESDFRYEELLRALKDFGAKGLVICESPSLEEDALLLQETYGAL